jgi:hypothetical protein
VSGYLFSLVRALTISSLVSDIGGNPLLLAKAWRPLPAE